MTIIIPLNTPAARHQLLQPIQINYIGRSTRKNMYHPSSDLDNNNIPPTIKIIINWQWR